MYDWARLPRHDIDISDSDCALCRRMHRFISVSLSQRASLSRSAIRVDDNILFDYLHCRLSGIHNRPWHHSSVARRAGFHHCVSRNSRACRQLPRSPHHPQVLRDLSHLETAKIKPLCHVQQLRAKVRPSLPLAWQRHWSSKLPLVFLLCRICITVRGLGYHRQCPHFTPNHRAVP